MLNIDVYVMDTSTGLDKWVTIPNSDLDSLLPNFDREETTIMDCGEEAPIDPTLIIGSNAFNVNDSLVACNSAGVDDWGSVEALCSVCGISYLDDEDLPILIDHSAVHVTMVDRKYSMMNDKETAARFLATEKYVPFGDLKASDLVFVEDYMVDYINWEDVWDDYRLKGYSEANINGTVYIVEC